MKKTYCVICGKYRKFRNPKIYIFEKTFLSIICSKCGTEDEKIFKVEDSIEVLKILGIFSYFKNMADENSRWKI